MKVIRLAPGDLQRVVEIDRSETVDHVFEVSGGELRSRAVERDVPSWHREGSGKHTVESVLGEWQPVVDAGAVLLGVEGQSALAGMAIVVPGWEPARSWLAFLYVTRAARRTGVAAVLWDECERLAVEAGAAELCVSSAPAGPAVRFYLSRGCILAPDPHPELVAKEPDDIQLVKRL